MGKQIDGPAGAYYHIRNPYRFFSTQSEALSDLKRLRRNGFKPRKVRVPTFYTILQDKRKQRPRKYGSVPQGPHTFPHHGIFRGIAAAMEMGTLDEFGDLMVLTPLEYGKRVDLEIPKSHRKRGRAEIAIGIYEEAYRGYLDLRLNTSRSEFEDIKLAHRISRLRNLDPWATYAYWGAGAGAGALKGKGESRNKPLIDQIDLPRNAGFANRAAVKSYLESTAMHLEYFGV